MPTHLSSGTPCNAIGIYCGANARKKVQVALGDFKNIFATRNTRNGYCNTAAKQKDCAETFFLPSVEAITFLGF